MVAPRGPAMPTDAVASTGKQPHSSGPRKPYKFIGFGDIHGPKPYKFIGFGGSQGPEKHTNIEDYFPEMGFDVSPAVPGRRATVHD